MCLQAKNQTKEDLKGTIKHLSGLSPAYLKNTANKI